MTSRSTIIRAGSGTHVEPVQSEMLQLTGDPLDVARAAAERAGYEEGRRLAAIEAEEAAARAEQELETRISGALAFLENAALFVRAQLGDELDRLARSATELSLAITEALLQRELELARDPGADAIARALDLVGSDAPAVAHCNPEDLELIGNIVHPALTLLPDPSIGHGGCLLDTGATLVDARIETALGRVRAILERAGGDRDD